MLSTNVDRYLTAARQEGLSEATIQQYRWHLYRLIDWLGKQDIDAWEGIDRHLIRQWGADIRDGWSPATVKQAVSVARSFFTWCHREELIPTNPGQALKTPRVPLRVQRTLSLDEIRTLCASCVERTIKGKRDLALISLMLDTGLRASEICRVRLARLDVENCSLVVRIKGGREAVAHFGAASKRRLKNWLGVRRASDGVDELFVSVGGLTPGESLTTEGLRKILRDLGNKAGVPGVSPHAFRRSFACIATDLGAPSRTVQLAGRWSDIRMVERYTLALKGKLHTRWSPADQIDDDLQDHP